MVGALPTGAAIDVAIVPELVSVVLLPFTFIVMVPVEATVIEFEMPPLDVTVRD